MKICKKCKTGNETSSRFCYQCGIKLQAGFPKLALPKSRGLKRSSSSFNPSQFIAHPMQDTSTIITAKNQGDLLHPKVQENVQKSIVSKAQVLKEVQGRLSKAPKSLKNSAPKLNLPELRIPDTCVESKEKLRAKKSHASILNPDQKLLLQKQLPTFKGVKPNQASFDMIKVEKMKVQELEKQVKAKRQKQIEKDLAYLDQLFPKDKKKASAKQKEVSVEAIAQETQKPEDILKELETAPVQEEVQKKVIDKIAIKKKSPEQKTILNSSKSNQWVRSLKNNKQKSPSDELKNYQTGDSSELITPLLTFASFIYFFYVLYI